MSDAIDEHIEHVRELTRRHGLLDLDSPTASVHNPEWFVGGRPLRARGRMHAEIIGSLLDGADAEGRRHAFVLAGAPGAGKSHLCMHELSDEVAGHAHLDVDDVKAELLWRAERDQSYEEFLKPALVREYEARGERFFPLELSALVHREAAGIVDLARERALSAGLPVVIDGVLSNGDQAVALGRELEGAGYSIDVVCLDVAPEVSEHQIRHRWRKAYEETLAGHGDLMGGRWVPSSFAQQVLQGPGGRSLPAVGSERLADEVEAVSRYRVFTRAGVDDPTLLATDLSRVRAGGPLIDTEAARAYRTARGTQRPHRAGRGGAVEGGVER